MFKPRRSILLFVVLAIAMMANTGLAQGPDDPPVDEITSVEETNATNVTGTLPWSTSVVDQITGSYTGQFVSMKLYGNPRIPYISYYDAKNKDLRLAHPVAAGTGNCGPNNAWKCETVDSTGDVGQFSSIDVINGSTGGGRGYAKIGISYYDATNAALKYAVFACAVTCKWTIYEVDDSATSGDIMGQYTSAKFGLTGAINIAYYYFANGSPFDTSGVKYAYFQGGGAGNCGDGSNWKCDIVDDSILSMGKGISLDIDEEGIPLIAYYYGGTGDLKYAWFSGIGNCGTGNTYYCVVIDALAGADVGKFVSLHAPDSTTDKIKLAYYDATNGKIRYAVEVGAGGNCTATGFNCYAVDTVGTVISWLGLSLSVDNKGEPVIAYMNASSEFSATKLNVARPASAMGELIGNCGDVPPGYLFMNWWCKTIDNGYQDIVNEGDFAAVGVSPSGLVTVAYFESDDYNLEGRLKVSSQSFVLHLPYIKR